MVFGSQDTDTYSTQEGILFHVLVEGLFLPVATGSTQAPQQPHPCNIRLSQRVFLPEQGLVVGLCLAFFPKPPLTQEKKLNLSFVHLCVNTYIKIYFSCSRYVPWMDQLSEHYTVMAHPPPFWGSPRNRDFTPPGA